MSINSREYWEQRFRNDWDASGGEAQSRFFARLALGAMPAWFLARLREADFSLCDWGCAEGAGTEFLAEEIGIPVTGIDFSEEAIRLARHRHSRAEFLALDVLAAPLGRRFDVVFSSNTLEHFRAPWEAFDAIAAMAGRYVALLLPYRETQLHPEHFVAFTPSGLPVARNGMVLVHAVVIEASLLPDSAWPGEQVFCLYARNEEIQAAGIALSDLLLESPAVEALRDRVGELPDLLAQARADAERSAVALSLELGLARQEAISLAHRLGDMERVVEALERDAAESRSRADALSRQVEGHASVEAELAALRRQLPKLQLDSQDLARIRNSRAWRWSAPIRLLRRVASGRMTPMQAWRSLLASVARTPLLGRRTRDALVRASRVDVFDPGVGVASPRAAGVLEPAGIVAGKPDVFVWAVIDWHFRIQRPQHLARSLATRGHRVFYISNNCIDSDAPGFSVQSLDADGRLFQVNLHAPGSLSIYHDLPDAGQADALRSSLRKLLSWARTEASVSLVQHPFWSVLAGIPPNVRCVYDCMDHHAGFEDNAPALIEAERSLVERCDLVVVTSGWLEHKVGGRARATALIRNAGDHGFFSTPPRRVFRDPRGRRVIGYYGAIAQWFDCELVGAVANGCPDALVLLIGADTAGAAVRLQHLPNVHFQGEVPYADLPYWVHGFDVCLLPFTVTELTLATNPVKVYEYLGAGKEVVAVDLPEMAQFGGLVRTARTRDEFVRHVRAALVEPPDEARKMALQAFAARQTWDHRAAELDAALAEITEPAVSVIVLAYNNLELTRACLESISMHSDYPGLEVIVVDNASSDGTAVFLREWERDQTRGHVRKVITNADNLGFAAGNNVGLAAAGGEYFILLNNDTYVTPGWVRTLLSHLRADPGVGLVGPVTNNIGNEAKVDLDYVDMRHMLEVAGDYTRSRAGLSFAIETLAFFCVAFRREVYERVGGLDEAFGMGFFEDDDYCRRVAGLGWRVICAEDVFVHHHLSATFDKLPSPERAALFERNRGIYEAKWGAWRGHRHRDHGADGRV